MDSWMIMLFSAEHEVALSKVFTFENFQSSIIQIGGFIHDHRLHSPPLRHRLVSTAVGNLDNPGTPGGKHKVHHRHQFLGKFHALAL